MQHKILFLRGCDNKLSKYTPIPGKAQYVFENSYREVFSCVFYRKTRDNRAQNRLKCDFCPNVDKNLRRLFHIIRVMDDIIYVRHDLRGAIIQFKTHMTHSRVFF